MKKIIVPIVCLLFGIGLINSCKKDSVIPTLTTKAVSNITINSVTTGGDITSNGGEEVTARGTCWSTSRNPSVSGSHTTDGTGIGSFTSNITGLAPNTMYYVKAYATNSVGTAYGEEVSFTTTAIVVPTLTTAEVTAIALTTAVSGGNITADGGGAITARGTCWGIAANPTITNDKTSDGTGTGIFTSNLTGLLPATTYYIRSYATNSAGTSYGNELSFTTSPIVVPTLTTAVVSAITLNTAVSGGEITSDGGGAITEKGVCWATVANPTLTNSKTNDGTGTGVFTSNITTLLPGTTYYVRSYATNSAGTGYGNELSFTTNAIVVATITTSAVTSITLTTAVSGGNITADGGGAITAKGVCWAVTASPTIANFKSSDGTGTGIFTSNLSALLPGVTYYVRAYATNSAGTTYGNEVSFTTSPIIIPTLTTVAVTSVALTTAVSGGIITADGGGAVSARGTCWSTAVSPTIAGSKTSDGSGTGTFVSNLTGLTPATTYYVRSYATNSAGTAYGNQLSFTTNPIVVPTLTTTAVTSITMTTAVSGGSISADGGGAVTAKGVCWATTTAPDITDPKTTNGTGIATFVSTLTALLPGTTYYVRSYATNSAGTAYGNEISFITSPVLVPTVTTAVVSSITQTTAISGGSVTADGGAAVTARGVCWSTTVNPTTASSLTTNGTGIGSFVSNLSSLTPGTTYYIRAYATNSAGTAYGTERSFITAPVNFATLSTVAVTSVGLTTALSGGDITADGGGAITARGVCWSNTALPTISDFVSSNGTGTGSFASNLTLLDQGTTYFVRAYATNSAGTAYGNQFSFNTKLADVDLNTYNTVAIGTQIWMAENLKTTKLNDNITLIPNVTDGAAWAALTTLGYSWYENDDAYKPTYGALYNWYAVNTGDLCPAGWRVPTDDDFKTLETSLGMPPADLNLSFVWRGTDQGSELKNTSGWATGENGTNTSGFSALPGGYRYYFDGAFQAVGMLSYWWTSTELDAPRAWYRELDGNELRVYGPGLRSRPVNMSDA